MTNVTVTEDAVTIVASTDPVQVKAGGQAAVDAHNQDADAHPNASSSAAIDPGRAKSATQNPYIIPGATLVRNLTKARGGGTVLYAPLLLDVEMTFDEIACEVTTAAAASSVARMGIYNADVDWQPTSLVVDAGEVAIDTTGIKTIAIAQTLAAGRYLTAYTANNQATLRAYEGAVRGASLGTAGGTFTASTYVTKAYGALATPGTAWDTIENLANTPHLHHIFLRRSA